MDIQINTGAKEFNLGGKVSVWFNPTDMAFAQRIYDTFAGLEEQQNKYTEMLRNADEDASVFVIGQEMDKEMRDAVNGVFGVDVVTPLIGDMNVYAFADGLPIWANILMAVLDTMSDTVKEETKRSKQRIDKYTKKYHR